MTTLRALSARPPFAATALRALSARPPFAATALRALSARPPFAATALRAAISLAIAAALAVAAAPAAASPLSDALARHGDADIAALRPRAAEPAARCTLGAIHARRGDLPRAALYLVGCDNADLPSDLAAAVRDAMRDLKRRLDASRLSSLDVVTEPEGPVRRDRRVARRAVRHPGHDLDPRR